MTSGETCEGTSSSCITVAVINYNGMQFLEELLQSLADQTYRHFDILFIDNGSTDDSVALVKNRYPDVQLIANDRNLGFAHAGNLGIKRSENDYVALLNTDLRLDPAWLESLAASIGCYPLIAAVASKLRFYDRPEVLNGIGGAMNRLGYTWDLGMNEVDRGQLDHPTEVLFASAGAALFNRTAFQEAGGFDETFFMYHEDVDLCWRLWLMGFRVVTAPSAIVYHHFGGATKAAKGMKWREHLGERNNMRALLKNYELRTALRVLVQMLLLPQPAARKIGQLKNLLWNLAHLPGTLQLRRQIQRHRVRSDNELEHLIVQSNHVPVRL